MDDTGHQDSGARKGLPVGAGGIALIVVLALLLVFVLQNTREVPVDFLFWSFTSPLWAVILGSAIAGAVAWLAVGAVRQRRKSP